MKFRNKYYFLSNFYPSPFKIKKITFPTVEHYFQCMKCISKKEFNLILSCKSPSEAKKLGRKVKLRKGWKEIRVKIMKKGVYEKFKQNATLRKKLINIEGEIKEENTWNDTFWGVCNGDGKNILGEILMSTKKYFTITSKN